MLVPSPVDARRDWIKVLDFGIAKLRGRDGAVPREPRRTEHKPARGGTESGAFLGTPLYMAPEQFGKAEEADGKADVFALSVLLYELLSGKTPFDNSSLTLLNKPARPLDRKAVASSPKLAALITRMMALTPAERPTMAEVTAQLEALLPARARRQRRNRRLQIGAAVAVVLGIAGFFVWQRSQRVDLAEARLRALSVVQGESGLRAGDPLLRTQAVRALGQSRDLSLRPLLEPLLQNDSVQVAEAAAQSLAQVSSVEAQAPLLTALSSNPPPAVRVALAGALLRLHHPRGGEELRALLTSRDEVSRLQAALLLVENGDPAGAQLLRTVRARPGVGDDARAQIDSALAQAGDAEAQRRLGIQLETAKGPTRLFVAARLARLGVEEARAVLASAAQKKADGDEGGEQEALLAARLLAGLGETHDYPLLTETLDSNDRSDAERELASAGVGDSGAQVAKQGGQRGLRALLHTLEARGTSPRLRLAAAGALLQLAAGEAARLAEEGLKWARSALGSDNQSARELAAALLGDLEGAETVSPLTTALKDAASDVRREAARALGRKATVPAALALLDVVGDTEPAVRTEGIRALAQVVTALHQRGDRGADERVLDRLGQIVRSGDEVDRVAAAAALVQLGDETQRARLRAAQAAQSPQARRLAIELGEPDQAALIKALDDADLGVRFAAAKRLALLGSRQAIAVLREVLAAGGKDGLLAYALLRKLEERAAPPAGLEALLQSGDLPQRYGLLEVIPELPPELALRLLRIATLDPAAVIRRKGAELAAGFYKKTGQEPFLNLINSLRQDSEIVVRLRVSELLAMLTAVPPPAPAAASKAAPTEKGAGTQPGTQPSQPAQPDAPEVKPPDGDKPATGNGQVRLVGEEGLRVQIDRGPPTALGSAPIPLAAGRHRVSFPGGSHEFTVEPGETASVRIAATSVDQWLQDASDLLAKKDYAAAERLLRRARGQISRGSAAARQSNLAETAYLQGRVYQGQGKTLEALTEYHRYQKMPDNAKRPEGIKFTNGEIQKLAHKFGRIQIYTLRDGQCAVGFDEYYAPGEHLISLGGGKTQTVRAQAGLVSTVRQCQ